MASVHEKLVEIIFLEPLYSGREAIPRGGMDPKIIANIFGRGRPINQSSKCLYCRHKPTSRHKTITLLERINLESSAQQTTYDICETCINPLFAEASYEVKRGLRQYLHEN